MTRGRARSALPIALFAALVAGLCAWLVIVSTSEPGRDDAPEAGTAGDLAAAPESRDDDGAGATTSRHAVPTSSASGERDAGASDLAPAWMREALADDPAAVARYAVERDAQREVFDDPMRTLPRKRATIGVGGGVGGVFGGGAGGRAGSAPPTVRARVIDDATGEPVEGALVTQLLADEDGWAWRAGTVVTDGDGAFSVNARQRRERRPVLLVQARGYELLRIPASDVRDELRLRPAPGSGRGTVRGRAESPEGAPLAGLLFVRIESEHGQEGYQYAWCDTTGTFELAGLLPGRWRIGLGRKATEDVTVVEDGFSTVRLVADRPDAPPPERPGSDRRVVEVTGLDDGVTLRADGGPDVCWRAVVDAGVARFELPFGIWVLTVDRPNGAVMAVTVRDESGLQRIAFEPED